MNLIFKIKKNKQKGPVPVEVILKGDKRIYKEKVESADNVLEGLDKILKRSKMKIADIEGIKVDDLNRNRYTSYRIIKSIEKALKLKLS